MQKVKIRYILLIAVLVGNSPNLLFAQEKSELKPKQIIEKFIQEIGSEKWHSLKSRKEFSFVNYSQSENELIPIKQYEQVKLYEFPAKTLERHHYIFNNRSTYYINQTGCIWYYSTSSNVVTFFDPEPVKFDHKYPRTELMEVLNLDTFNKVFKEDTLYRVDFKDSRQLDGKHSLFFGEKSGLLYKRKYVSNNEVTWEYHFMNYKESQGFKEPRHITLKSNGESYFKVDIDSIVYNSEIKSAVFEPPVPCQSSNNFTRLSDPFFIEIE